MLAWVERHTEIAVMQLTPVEDDLRVILRHVLLFAYKLEHCCQRRSFTASEQFEADGQTPRTYNFFREIELFIMCILHAYMRIAENIVNHLLDALRERNDLSTEKRMWRWACLQRAVNCILQGTIYVPVERAGASAVEAALQALEGYEDSGETDGTEQDQLEVALEEELAVEHDGFLLAGQRVGDNFASLSAALLTDPDAELDPALEAALDDTLAVVLDESPLVGLDYLKATFSSKADKPPEGQKAAGNIIHFRLYTIYSILYILNSI
jgi:hypothetical protein